MCSAQVRGICDHIIDQFSRCRKQPINLVGDYNAGGHTAEILALLRGFDLSVYTPRCYIVADTDKMSSKKAMAFETEAATLFNESSNKAISDTAVGVDSKATSGPQLKARRAARDAQTSSKPNERHSAATENPLHESYRVVNIPRSREVGQSFKSSILTTLIATFYALKAVFVFRPDVVLVNGPGTCIPVCVAALITR